VDSWTFLQPIVISSKDQVGILKRLLGHQSAWINQEAAIGSMDGRHWKVPSRTCSNTLLLGLAMENRFNNGGWLEEWHGCHFTSGLVQSVGTVPVWTVLGFDSPMVS